jgi:nucleoside-diphosphate-sugar epimerase
VADSKLPFAGLETPLECYTENRRRSFILNRLKTNIQARLARRLSPQSLGPVEGRVAYDLTAGILAAIVAALFCQIFLSALSLAQILALASLPALLLLFNWTFGIYSRLRTASGRIKAAVLFASVACSCAAAWWLVRDPAPVVLWALLSYAPLSLARLLLSLPYGRHKTLASIAVTQRGPVLVIGGAGYIGSHTVDLLLQAGHSVRVLDRLMYGSQSLAPFLGRRDFELIEGDVTDITRLTLAMKGASAVVHLAGLVGDPACAVDEQFTRHTNIVATRMAKDVAHSLGVHRFVFASSCSVYGMSDKEVGETDALNPVSMYAQTKIDSENELLYTVSEDFHVTVLRFATVFGHSPRPRFDLVGNLFTAQAMTDGLITVIGPQQWRPFIHVRDLARAIVRVLKENPSIVRNQVFNVGDKRLNMTILQLAESVQKVCAPYRDVQISVSDNLQDRRNYAVSFDKIRSLLDYEAATTLEEGIQEMVHHFQSGQYQHYREQIYSNVAMTRKALSQFHDPAEGSHLYAPLRLTPTP